jgi:hypothetical protein
MGMGYSANFGCVVGYNDIRSICGEEFDLLEKLLEELDSNMEELARHMDWDMDLDELEQEGYDKLMIAFEEVLKKFKEATGLELILRCHDQSDNGDRYDDVDGAFFEVSFDEVFELTSKAKRAEELGINIRLEQWVTYG